MTQLKQETEKISTTQSRLGSFINMFKEKIGQVKPSIGKMRSQLNQMPKITQNVTNNIKKMSGNLKVGLGHILKYAGALFGIGTIYNSLKASANSWLSSQNQGAQQLSANIDYMKYAMR